MGLAATVIVSIFVARIAKRAIDEATAEKEEMHADPQPQAH